jgi:hypothetical protein
MPFRKFISPHKESASLKRLQILTASQLSAAARAGASPLQADTVSKDAMRLYAASWVSDPWMGGRTWAGRATLAR